MYVSKDDFKFNLKKIDSLLLSFYEKDVIRSAYYNHINQTPIPKIANYILSKHKISFKDGNIIINDIEARKSQYKRQHESMDIYSKDFLKEYINTQSNILYTFIKEVDKYKIEVQQHSKDSKEVLSKCFKSNEYSYNMILDMINNIDEKMEKYSSMFNSFLKPFLESFYDMQVDNRKEILNKSNEFLNKIKDTRDCSFSLYIKILSIKAHNEISRDDSTIKHIQDTIDKLDKYTKI